MKPMANRLFAPEASNPKVDAALLVLRVWLGLTMLINHGLPKLTHFKETAAKFIDFLGIGSQASLGMALFAEVFCSALLIFGLVTRFGALSLAINMIVAFAMVHKGALSGEHSGELAFLYLAGYVTILLAGPGRYSADGCLFAKPSAPATT